MALKHVAGAAVAVGGLGGCALIGPSRITMEALYSYGCAGVQAPVLLVLLPGANMALDELEREGFIAAVRERGLAVDVVRADANLAYAYDGSILRRLHTDVIAPARARGYRRVWLAGISLGGFIALAYAFEHPGEIEGLFAIAPYLGKRSLLQSIEDAGGPAAWRRSAPVEAADNEQRLWKWLTALPADAPSIWLGYGTEDRLIQGQRLLAEVLASHPPAGRVATAPGGHAWAPWRRLWSQWLDRGLLPRACG